MNWLRRWLYTPGYVEAIERLHKRVDAFERDLVLSQDNIRHEIFLLRNDLSVTMGDEHDPKRQALSKELGERMRTRLLGEENARRHTEGKPPLKELPTPGWKGYEE